MERKLAWQALGMLFSVACSGAPAAPTIGPGGGTVAGANGAKIEIPAGALKTNVVITATLASSATPPEGTVAVSAIYALGPEGQQFDTPVRVTLPINLDLLPEGTTANDILVLTAPAGTNDYVPLFARMIDATHVEAETTHFSWLFGASVGCRFNVPACGWPSLHSSSGCVVSYSCGSDNNCHPFCHFGDCGRICEPTCDSTSCPGCCDTRGRCQSGTSRGACGGGGRRCAACSDACQSGACSVQTQCGNVSCAGCCMNNQCIFTYGACSATSVCLDGACVPCGAAGQPCCAFNGCGATGCCVVTGSGTPPPRSCVGAGSTCTPFTNGMCSGGKCGNGTCGAQGLACCSSGMCTSQWADCSGGNCGSCGDAGSRCCPGGVCKRGTCNAGSCP